MQRCFAIDQSDEEEQKAHPVYITNHHNRLGQARSLQRLVSEKYRQIRYSLNPEHESDTPQRCF